MVVRKEKKNWESKVSHSPLSARRCSTVAPCGGGGGFAAAVAAITTGAKSGGSVNHRRLLNEQPAKVGSSS